MAQMLQEWGKHCFEITTAFNLYDLGPRSLQSSCPRPMCGGTLRKANAGASWLRIVPHSATYSRLWPLPLFHKFHFSIPDMATNLFSAILPTYLLCIKCSISTNFGFLCGMLPLSLSSPPLTVALRQDLGRFCSLARVPSSGLSASTREHGSVSGAWMRIRLHLYRPGGCFEPCTPV